MTDQSCDTFYGNILQELQKPISDDPLIRCGEGVISQISSNPDAALEYADKELHVFPFKDVDVCWRRLYTDAGISKALQSVMSDEKPKDWLDQVVRQLDIILIMTGAPLREEMVEKVFDRLQTDNFSVEVNFEDKFATNTLRRPSIEYPVPASQMTLSQFERHLVVQRPHVIKSTIDHWPALSDRPWKSPSYLKYRTLGGRRLVPVELGRSYTDEDWSQKIMPFSEFLERYIANPDSGLGYLAQHDLFLQVSALRKDILIPDFCFTEPPPPDLSSSLHGKPINQLDEPLLNAWFGPAGTISPLHTDPYHNILCQVVGKKYVRLYAPDQTAKLYPRAIENGIDMSNTSGVPVELVEMSLGEDEDFPLFNEATYVETILEEGNSLYIPVGWWHYVRSLSTSFSVSFWWN